MEITLTATELHVLSIALEMLIEKDQEIVTTRAIREQLAEKLAPFSEYVRKSSVEQVVLHAE